MFDYRVVTDDVRAKQAVMMTILRNIAAVVVGLLIGGMINMALVIAGPKLIPPPEGIDMTDAKSLAAGVHLLQPKHFVFPLLAHAVGTFAAGLVAYVAGVGRREWLSYGIGIFSLAGGITAAIMITAPPWFVALDLIGAYLPMAWLATRVGRALSGAC